MSYSDQLAARVRQGHDLLRARQAELALPILDEAAHDPELAKAADLQDVRVHILSLWAEANLEAGRLDGASRALDEAEALARTIEDDPGLRNLVWLRDRLSAERAERHKVQREAEMHRRLAEAPADTLLDGAKSDAERADRLLRKATALVEVGDAASAVPFAESALDHAIRAGIVREEVLARLILARSDRSRAAEQLRAASDRATGAAETALLAAVVRTSELTGVALPAEPFGGRKTT